MAVYTSTNPGVGDVQHDGVVETEWADVGPLITPAELRTKHLLGIPLVSGWRDPNTKLFYEVTNDDLKDFIVEAASLAETESGVEIFPRARKEKHAFDKAAYESYGYMMLRHRPVSSIEKLAIVPSNGIAIFEIPMEWIDPGNVHQGQINLIPFTAAFSSGGVGPIQAAAGGYAFLAMFGHSHWIPSFWQCEYTTGYQNSRLPRDVNQLIGVIAAMEVLSNLAATWAKSTSQSLGLDGMSQSTSGPGPQLFETRLGFLAEKRKWLVRKIQRKHNLGFIVDNV